MIETHTVRKEGFVNFMWLPVCSITTAVSPGMGLTIVWIYATSLEGDTFCKLYMYFKIYCRLLCPLLSKIYPFEMGCLFLIDCV